MRTSHRVAVVCGGPSAEASVSRISGNGVAEALRATFAHVDILELDTEISRRLTETHPDIVFPVLHGPVGEDGTFQGFLEILRLPYVGSGVHASACAMDKIVSKQLFRTAGLPVAPDLVISRRESIASSCRRIWDTLGQETVIKPARQGSALGVSFPNSPESLKIALERAFQYDDSLLAEKRIHGREVTVGILENPEAQALPAIEILTPQDSWYDFEHRYTAGLSRHIVPAGLPAEQYSRVLQIAKSAHQSLGCRDLSRADFIVPFQGDPVLLEVNTLPGMTPTSLYPDAARAAGISFESLVALLVDRAADRQ